MQRHQNILITSATGCGISFLACAIGYQTCLLGYRTHKPTQKQIALAKIDGSFIKWLNLIKKAHLVILDDFRLQPISQQVKFALLRIIEDHYENASTFICSQLSVSKWHEYFAEPISPTPYSTESFPDRTESNSRETVEEIIFINYLSDPIYVVVRRG